MDFFSMTAADTLASLGTNPTTGLSDEQVPKNRERYGKNELTRAKPVSLLRRFLNALKEPMMLLLLFAAVITLGVNIARAVTGGHADFVECVGIFGAILLSICITIAMEGRSAKAFEELNKINDDVHIKVLRNGEKVTIPVAQVVVGDIVCVETGDKLPADGRLIDAVALRVDESALTGESEAVKKDAQAVFDNPKTPVAERKNTLYSGCFVTGGSGTMVVTHVGDGTQFGQIAAELSHTRETSTPLQEKLGRMGKVIAIIGGIVAAIVFLVQTVGFIMDGTASLDTISNAFITSIILMVAAVPEGLPTIVAVSLAINIIKMSKQNALVKKMQACETIGCINVICSDKTGTLTQNRMTVVSVYADESTIEPYSIENSNMLKNFCINATADLKTVDGTDTFIGNPTECALLSAARKSGTEYKKERENAKVLQVFPFSSETKNMTTVIKDGDGQLVLTKGSPEKILAMCDITPQAKEKAEQQILLYQQRSCRVLAFAHKNMHTALTTEQPRETLETGMTFDGFAAIADPLREDVFEAVSKCRSAGIEIKMLTGDNIVTATAIANELHMLDNGGIAVQAAEIEEMSDDELRKRLPEIRVIARSTPIVKMRVVNMLKAEGNVVAVTGDGINDAPAIKNADVGMAMGISGTEVSKEASDIVLLDDSFSTITRAVEWGRGIYENFRRFIQFQLTVNFSSVVVVLASILMGFAAPFTALQLLWINLVMDGPPALTLGLEPIRDDLMRRRPTRRNENIISKTMLGRIAINGAYISAVFLAQHSVNFLGVASEQSASVLFTMFVLFQLFNAFNCRELGNTTLFKNILSNKLMLLVFGGTFILQFIITQYGGAVFGTAPLDAMTWLKITGIAFTVIPISEFGRLIMRVAEHVKSRRQTAGQSR